MMKHSQRPQNQKPKANQENDTFIILALVPVTCGELAEPIAATCAKETLRGCKITSHMKLVLI